MGHSFTFVVQTNGYPIAAISESGALAKGLTFTDHHNGTATISGTPAFGSGGRYFPTLKAANSSGSVTQALTLTVDQAPAFTSPASAVATVGHSFTFVVQTNGYPIAAISESGALAKGLTFTDHHNGTATISGTPAFGSGGRYFPTLKAANSSGSVTQALTLTVDRDRP